MPLPVPMLTGLSLRDSLIAVVSGALISHLAFKRWEPTNLAAVLCLLLIVPGALSAIVIPNLPGAASGIALTFLVYYTSLVTSILIYRTTFLHPLSRYPGPWQARISKAWLIYKDWHGRQHLYIEKLHKTYGNVVRIGPNELSIRDPSIVLPMMGTSGLGKGPSIAGRAMNPPVRSLIATSDPSEHARRRRPWNRAFSTAALKEYHPIIHKRATQLTERLGSTTGANAGQKTETEANRDTWTDLTQWIAYFAYDFMGDMVFGGGTELLRDGDPEKTVETMKKMFSAVMIFDHMPWLGDFAKKLPVAPRVKNVRGAAMARTVARFERGAHSRDLFYYLSNEDGVEKTSPPMTVLLSDAMLAVGAGSDTTASVLANIYFNILTHREYYQALQQEVDHFYPRSEDAMDTKHHSKMVWLEAIMNETLRLYPVLPRGSQRATIPGTGARVLGTYFVPEGTQVSVHFYSMQRDPTNFTSPTSFFPERWIIAEGGNYPTYTTKLPSAMSMLAREKLTHNPNAFLPFSFGPANCVGKNLALQEMKMVMCNLMQKLDMRLADWYNPSEWERKMQEQLVIIVDRLPVVVQRRE